MVSCSLFKMSSLNSFWRYLRYFPLITNPVLVRRPVPRFNWSSWGISVRVLFLTLGKLRNFLKGHYWNNRVIFSSSYPSAAVLLVLCSNNDSRSKYLFQFSGCVIISLFVPPLYYYCYYFILLLIIYYYYWLSLCTIFRCY